MKKTIILFFFISAFISCKQETKSVDKNSTGTFKIKNSEKAIKTLKEFYLLFYGNDTLRNDEKLMKKYVSERVLKKINDLSSDGENLILDYDPFINGQDYDGNIIRKTLKIEPLKNENEYSVSFLLFGRKDEKRTNIDILLEKDKNENFLIYSILNDKYLSFKDGNSSTTKNVLVNESEIIDSMKLDNYQIIKNEKCDLNGDGLSDVILIFNPTKEFTQQDETTLDSPVYILINKGGNTFEIYKNNHLIYTFMPNTPAEGFRNLIIKNNFFTIEQQEGGGKYFIDSYTTFKYDNQSKNIILSKYGKSYTDRNDPDKLIPDNIYTSKDFKTITFEEYDAQNLEGKFNQ
ncbi:DUF3828 domain-containing protein [Epilithonimonas sp. UC225_85]|uniref:DUF3828 domain-containing protein n=1 Tax=Epilithonimonas sp. UC225_85 TaxID=3350167 RepID=UPI0036D42200